MEDVLYLIHTTNNPQCVEWNELKTANFNTNDQYPGIFCSIITKHNIDVEHVFNAKYIIILSKKLLFQRNYHLNVMDYNGIIMEHNTYYPWDLDNYLNKIKLLASGEKRLANEIVFHDNIDMKYCCSIIGIHKRQQGIKINNFLPRIPIMNEEEPDLSKSPFFCYPFEDIYTGSYPLQKSSIKWYNMMSKTCNIPVVSTHNTRNKMITQIKNKAEYLYNNRDEQNIEFLRNYKTKRKRVNTSRLA